MLAGFLLLERATKCSAIAIKDNEFRRALQICEEQSTLNDAFAEWIQQRQLHGFMAACTEVLDSIKSALSLARGRCKLAQGIALRNRSVTDAIDVDVAFEALDELRDGLAAAKGSHLDLEAEILSEIGYLLKQVLKLDEPAHRAYRACMIAALRAFLRNSQIVRGTAVQCKPNKRMKKTNR